jgi:hypothetical protein
MVSSKRGDLSKVPRTPGFSASRRLPNDDAPAKLRASFLTERAAQRGVGMLVRAVLERAERLTLLGGLSTIKPALRGSNVHCGRLQEAFLKDHETSQCLVRENLLKKEDRV